MPSKTEYKSIPLSKLKPAKYNPRIIDDSAFKGLKNSITEFGNLQPIVWNKKTGNVVSGHQRLKVLLEQGVESTECIVINVDEVKERAINVTMNNPHISGKFERDGLADLMASIQDHIDMDALNLDDLSLDFNLELDPEIDIGENNENSIDGTLQYSIIFNDEIEQESWFKYLRYLKNKHPETETISERILIEANKLMDWEWRKQQSDT